MKTKKLSSEPVTANGVNTLLTTSQTEEPDKQGRWARLCFYRQFLIAWISRQQVNETVMYVVNDYFPTTEDFEKAKEGVEKRLKACC